MNRDACAGVLAMAIGLFFGLTSLGLGIGSLSDIGPGGFPLAVGSLVILLGAMMIVRSRLRERVPFAINMRAVLAINGAIVLFVVVTAQVGLVPGIVAMVFCSALAMSPYSVAANAAISGGLVVIGIAFQHFFNLALPLF